ncbi:MAG: porin [Betaproteobacteria bacterium]|nr:porin [Betaproteobacteria bacterium]
MQKKLIALAVAGLASTAAFAQTNVTVYGIADGTFDVIAIDGKPGNNGGVSANNFGDFNRVSANSSYIGFKGTEDLGNGLKAVFQFESSVNFDATGGTIAARDSFVGISSGFGTVVLGNLTAPTRALGAALDVNAGATGIGANSGIIGKMGGGTGAMSGTANCGKSTTCTSIFDTRWSNAIAYVSPTWGGFSFVGAYVADENKTADLALAGNGPTLRTTGYDIGAKWEGYGATVAAAYNWYQVGDIAGSKSDNLRLGASYGGAWGSVRAMWEVTRIEQLAPFAASTGILNGQSENDQQKWGIGATINVGKAQILAQYYQALESSNRVQDGAWLAEVGVQYNLSKRTMLKAVYAYLNNEGNATFDYGVNAAGATGTGSDIQGIQMGIRHAF